MSHPLPSRSPAVPASRAAGWVRHAPWLLALGLLAIRLAEQAFIGGYELAADEAQYWDWSRRLDGSYYTKGPGIAWAIAASTRPLGDAAWAVRLPGLLAWAGTILVAAALAKRAVGSRARAVTRDRAGAFAAALTVCCPVLFAVGQFATIDAPYLFCWAVAAWLVTLAMDRVAAGSCGLRWWAAAGVAIGVGFLFKYTALLVLVGVVGVGCTGVLRRWGGDPRLRPAGSAAAWGAGPRLLAGWGVLLLAALAAGTPVWWWNHLHGWPTVAHLLGHLGAEGGDLATPEDDAGPAYHPLWTLSYVGIQLAIAGPGLWVMFALATRRLVGRRSGNSRWPLATGRWLGITRDRLRPAAQGRRPAGHLNAAWTLWWLGVTPLAFYLLVSFVAETEANWPIAGYATLVPLAGAVSPWGWRRWRALRRKWRALPPPRPKWGLVRRSPETPWQAAWHWALAWGGAAAVGVVFGPLLLSIAPGVDEDAVLERVRGHEAWAGSIMAAVRGELGATRLADAAWASDRYGEAALLAYYLPTRPSVHSIESLAGGRESSYDYFADTNLWRDALRGRPMIAVGGGRAKWQATLRFDSIALIHRIDDNDAVFLLRGYRGPKQAAPERTYAPGMRGSNVHP